MMKSTVCNLRDRRGAIAASPTPNASFTAGSVLGASRRVGHSSKWRRKQTSYARTAAEVGSPTSPDRILCPIAGQERLDRDPTLYPPRDGPHLERREPFP